MPRFSKHNDAVRYDTRLKFQTYTAQQFNDLVDAIKASSGYKMVTWDTLGTEIMNKEVFAKIHTEGEW